jgi:prephenate dehydrogenase
LGLANAEAGLFQGAPFAFTRLEHTTGRAQRLASQVAETVGAKALWIDADTHDRWTAATSHLPYLLASALVLATPADASRLTGPGFRSMTRLAATPPAMMLDVVDTNRDHILDSLGKLRGQIDILEALLEQGDGDQMKMFLSRSAAYKNELE